MKTFVMGDVHGEMDFHKVYREAGHENDRLLQVGDFGLVFNVMQTRAELDRLKDMQNHWKEVFLVDGNHENFTRLNRFPLQTRYGGKVRQLAPNVFWMQRGEVFDFDGQTVWAMGGADSVDKHWRTKDHDWWAEELPTWDEMNYGMDNLEKVDWKVDYVLSHTCPNKVKHMMMQYMRLKPNDVHLEKYFDEVVEKLDFYKWYFGHFHVDVTLGNQFVGLFNYLVELGDEVPEHSDDFKSGFMAPDQCEGLPPLPCTKEEVLRAMKKDYLG